jgi:lysozyme
MKLNKAGADLIKSFEGLKLTAYKCSAKKDTIGYGNTFYEDGSPVKPGDKITKERADSLFELISDDFAKKVVPLVKSQVNENQFGALVSFAYNAGIGNLKSSTLLKKVNANPSDASIRLEFMKWDKAGGKQLAGLTRRRKAEADLYFKPVV